LVAIYPFIHISVQSRLLHIDKTFGYKFGGLDKHGEVRRLTLHTAVQCDSSVVLDTFGNVKPGTLLCD